MTMKNISVLTSKTTREGHSNLTVESRVASGSNPVSGPTATSTQSGTASGGSKDPASSNWWRRRKAGWQIVTTYPSSASTGGGTSEAQGGSLSGLGNSRR
jgi:hypothetical protein